MKLVSQEQKIIDQFDVHKFLLFTIRELYAFVNMKDYKILDQRLQSVFPILNCTGNWGTHANKAMDALVTMIFPNGEFNFDTLINQEVRENTLLSIQNLNDTYPNFLLLAYRIYQNYLQLLQEMKINYLGANGNAFIQKTDYIS